MFVVKPAAIPLTMPVPAPIEATVGALLVHTPPDAGFVNVIVWPTHTIDGPPIAPIGFTVTALVAMQPKPDV